MYFLTKRTFTYYNQELNNNYRVIISNHMFRKRKNQKFKRGHMFKTVGQVERLLGYCLTKHDLEDYDGKGKVVVKFTYKDEIYGLLLEIRYNPNIEDSVADITLITVDKQDDRHYNRYAMFHNETNLINMTEYKLRPSYCSDYTKPINLATHKLDNIAFKLVYYDNLNSKVNRLLDIAPELSSFTNAFINKITKLNTIHDIYDNGAHWYKITLVTDVDLYLRISIVKIDENVYYILLLNIVGTSNYKHLRKDNELIDPYVELDIKNKIGLLKKDRIGHNNNGLRIKNKVRKENEKSK